MGKPNGLEILLEKYKNYDFYIHNGYDYIGLLYIQMYIYHKCNFSLTEKVELFWNVYSLFGNPLQDSSLKNPMDRGARQAMVHGVKDSRTQLKWLSTHTLTVF